MVIKIYMKVEIPQREVIQVNAGNDSLLETQR